LHRERELRQGAKIQRKLIGQEFSVTGQKRGDIGKRGKTIPAPHAGNGTKD
jgi:hypothetical protein